jgi:ribosomal protein S18 acetylase RimI-like enzyme
MHRLARIIEPLAFRAWQGDECRDLDGWRLRFNQAVTNRANSVLACDVVGPRSLEDRIDLVEQFYRERGQPARFQITPISQPEGLDDALAARGYERYAPVQVQTASASQVASTTGSDREVRIETGPFDEWFEISGRRGRFRGEDSETYRRLLLRAGPRAAFALARSEGAAVGVGLAVASGDWAGIFSMLTLPDARRRGVGASVLRALARWAAAAGTRRLYLQVEQDNPAAIALYAGAGFSTAYHYHYRRGPRA